METLEFGNEKSSAIDEYDSSAADSEAMRCDSAADIEDSVKAVEKVELFRLSLSQPSKGFKLIECRICCMI